LRASISSLFHGPWPSDDPEFLTEVKHYQSTLTRMLLLDSELTHHIQSQSLLDSDHLSTPTLARSIHKAQLVSSVESSSQQCSFNLTTSPVNLSRLFLSIKVEVGSKEFQYLTSEKPAETIYFTFDAVRVNSIKVTCSWNLPLLKLSPVLQKLMGAPIALLCDVATRLLAHIDSRNLCEDGEVKCDGPLRILAGSDRFEITNLSEIIEKNTQPIEPLVFNLDLPNCAKAFVICFPDVNRREGAFAPVQVPAPPIREFLEAALEAKEQLVAMEEFERDPQAFVDEMLLREARLQNPKEFVNSSYFFCEPWVGEAAADLLKASEYVKAAGKRVPPRPA
jgi:hypothetical protein